MIEANSESSGEKYLPDSIESSYDNDFILKVSSHDFNENKGNNVCDALTDLMP